MVTRQIRVSGLVQGVGYRVAMRRQAQTLGVSGWVRNRADGTVEAIIAWARRGPHGSLVADVQITPADARELPQARFELRPTA